MLLHQGDSAPVVCILMFSVLHKIVNLSLMNSSPLYLRSFSTVPYITTQYFMIALTTWVGFFDVITTVTESLVTSTTII